MTVLARLGLHPEKTRMIDLSRGCEGFDSRMPPAQPFQRLDPDAATGLLPASVTVSTRDGAGARVCA
jgi:hypothetical protein